MRPRDLPHPPVLPAARKAMQIASDSCIYTNAEYTTLHIDASGKISELDIKAAAEAAGAGDSADAAAAAGQQQQQSGGT